ncbi:MAG: HD family phosphohydrolase [Vampirovibrionia bacterium]
MSVAENNKKAKFSFNKLLKFIKSIEGQRYVVAIITLILLTLILCSRYFSFQSVVDDGISKQEVIATKTIEVVDKNETALRRKEAADKVSPVFKPVEGDIDYVLMNNLTIAINIINQIRKEISEDNSKAYKIDDLIRNTPLEKNNNSLNRYLLVDASDYNWVNIQDKSKKIVEKILKQGISEKELVENKSSLIKSYLTRSDSEQNKTAITALVNLSVDKPNIIIDQEQTNLAKRNAMDAVDNVKVYYKKGQLVVAKGEKVDDLQYEALKKLGYTVNKLNWFLVFGVFCFVVIAMYIVWYYLSRYEPEFANSPKHLALLSTLTFVSMLVALFVPDLPTIYNLDIPTYILPVAAVTIIISFFTNSRVSLLLTSMIIILISVVFNFPIDEVSVMVVGVIVAILKSSRTSYYRDSFLIECGVAIGLAQVLVVLSNFFITNNVQLDIDLQELVFKLVVALVSGFLTGAITIAAMPHLEAIFKIITSHGLMELADQNQPLLRRLQFEAPGTYHHSLMVSTLGEAAAEAIGASTILVRVGAFYHDIGKLKRPAFFIENQSYFGSDNPHDKLNPRLSKMVLTAHTKDGLDLARQYKLPEVIQNLIVEHHGEGVMLYFYMSALEMEGPEKVFKDQFRYAGPKPSSKESAIIMLADATESAVRSLNSPSISDIEEMIMKIVHDRVEDGQLSDSPITLKDIKIISSTFIRVLRGMQHHRIEYQDTMLEEFDKKQKDAKQKKDNIVKIDKMIDKTVHVQED